MLMYTLLFLWILQRNDITDNCTSISRWWHIQVCWDISLCQPVNYQHSQAS